MSKDNVDVDGYDGRNGNMRRCGVILGKVGTVILKLGFYKWQKNDWTSFLC
jgi:hypothetical protein